MPRCDQPDSMQPYLEAWIGFGAAWGVTVPDVELSLRAGGCKQIGGSWHAIEVQPSHRLHHWPHGGSRSACTGGYQGQNPPQALPSHTQGMNVGPSGLCTTSARVALEQTYLKACTDMAVACLPACILGQDVECCCAGLLYLEANMSCPVRGLPFA